MHVLMKEGKTINIEDVISIVDLYCKEMKVKKNGAMNLLWTL